MEGLKTIMSLRFLDDYGLQQRTSRHNASNRNTPSSTSLDKVGRRYLFLIRGRYIFLGTSITITLVTSPDVIITIPYHNITEDKLGLGLRGDK